jgi:sporulation protein YunB
LLAGLATALALFLLLDFSMRPAVESVVGYQAQVFAAKLINEAMLKAAAADYGELVRLSRGENGAATSIEANMQAINRLKYEVSSSVIEELEKAENHELALPLGTIIGNQFTSGRGPLIDIKVLPAGYVNTDVYNSFTSAGINQTLHRIMLRVSVGMAAVLPGYSVETETESSFCIAETVIIGEIPQGYAVIDGSQPMFSKIGGGE